MWTLCWVTGRGWYTWQHLVWSVQGCCHGVMWNHSFRDEVCSSASWITTVLYWLDNNQRKKGPKCLLCLNHLFHASALLTAMKEKCSEKNTYFFCLKSLPPCFIFLWYVETLKGLFHDANLTDNSLLVLNIKVANKTPLMLLFWGIINSGNELGLFSYAVCLLWVLLYSRIQNIKSQSVLFSEYEGDSDFSRKENRKRNSQWEK